MAVCLDFKINENIAFVPT